MTTISIIGGGISGLTAGVFAQKAGYETVIYEKNGIAGGECTGWDRDGFHIDNCIHWMMGTVKGTQLNRIWRETGALDDRVEIHSSATMYTSYLGDDKLSLWRDIDQTESEMIALSPDDEEEIRKLMNSCRKARSVDIPATKPMELMGTMDLVKMGLKSKNALILFREYENEDTRDLMNRFKHPLIRALISDFCTEESMGYSFPMMYGNFVGGDGGLPAGGSRAMALRMADRYEKLGGKIRVGASASKFVVSGGKISTLVLSHGEKIESDYYISACDPDYTFNKLLDPSYLDPVLKEVYSYREAYPVYGMFQVAFAVDSPVDVLLGESMFESGALRFAPWVDNRITVKCYSYEPSFAPPGKQIIQGFLGMKEEGYDYWSALYKDKTAYNNRKNELALQFKDILEEKVGLYKGKMTLLDVWTPMTYKRYCNAFKGYSQAFTITKRSMKNPNPSAFVKGLDNLILAGQWLSPPGGLPGAAIQGKFAVQRLLKKEGKKNYRLD